jgi:hypothetical protein
MTRIVFRAAALSLPVLAAVGYLYVVSYASIPSAPVTFDGDYGITGDPEVGFLAPPNARTTRTDVSPRHAPFTYHLYTDARGARVTTPGQRSPSRVDVIAIGCSFTWGPGIENEETYAARLSDRLHVGVSNFAMGSYGTVQSLLMLRRNRDLRPKLVVYGLIADHLRRNLMPCAGTFYPFCLDVPHIEWDAAGRFHIAPPSSDGVARLRLHMKAQTRGLDPLTWMTHGIDVAYNRFRRFQGDSLEANVSRSEMAFAFLMQEMSRSVSELGAKLLVVYIPMNFTPLPDAVRHALEGLDLTVIDTTDVFLNARTSGGSPPYIQGDGHPSASGHALIADEIVRVIEQRHLLAPGDEPGGR